jgi:serine/threonine protein kinase
LSGASSVVSLDMDNHYLDMIRKAQAHLGWKQIRAVNCRVQDWNESADLVLAYAMIHWLYSCTANYGSLDAVIGKLAGLANCVLLVEWVAPEDPAIKFFNHTEWNADVPKEGYSLEAFEAAMHKHFKRVEIIGSINSTRVLYVGHKQMNEVTLQPALPLLAPAERVISSHFLTKMDGVSYYSRVYVDESGDRMIKQATGDLALHEAEILSRLSGSFFPKIFTSEAKDGYSVMVMERIKGSVLAETRSEICSTPKRLAQFMGECLLVIRQLQDLKILHRDVRLNNFMVRDGHPVLIDFGWAQLDGIHYLNPEGLGGNERATGDNLCDVYSLGKVFEQIVPQKTDLFAPLFEIIFATKLSPVKRIKLCEQKLRELSLPDIWETPVTFKVLCRPDLQHREPWLKRTVKRWKRSLRKRLKKVGF